MNKKLMVLSLSVMVLGSGYVMAQEEAAVPAVVQGEAEILMANNKICPISGRELNFADINDFATLEVEGVAVNICPMAKAAYEANSAQFADQIAQVVAAAKAPVVEDVAVEVPAEAVVPAAAY